MDFTDADVASLGAKLDGLDLSEGEAAALSALLDAAGGPSEPDVVGHAHGAPRIGSFGARLGTILFFDEADALFGKSSGFIGETEKNLRS